MALWCSECEGSSGSLQRCGGRWSLGKPGTQSLGSGEMWSGYACAVCAFVAAAEPGYDLRCSSSGASRSWATCKCSRGEMHKGDLGQERKPMATMQTQPWWQLWRIMHSALQSEIWKGWRGRGVRIWRCGECIAWVAADRFKGHASVNGTRHDPHSLLYLSNIFSRSTRSSFVCIIGLSFQSTFFFSCLLKMRIF